MRLRRTRAAAPPDPKLDQARRIAGAYAVTPVSPLGHFAATGEAPHRGLLLEEIEWARAFGDLDAEHIAALTWLADYLDRTAPTD